MLFLDNFVHVLKCRLKNLVKFGTHVNPFLKLRDRF